MLPDFELAKKQVFENSFTRIGKGLKLVQGQDAAPEDGVKTRRAGVETERQIGQD